MRSRLWIVIAALLLASMACSLAIGEEEPSALSTPTDAPTSVSGLATPTRSANATPTPAPTATQRPAATSAPVPVCTVRADWPTVIVQGGDTLFGIALQVGASVQELVTANCLANANTIEVGQALHVPNLPPPPPLPTQLPACPNQWFFMFVEGEVDPLGTCPGAVTRVEAVGQDFEGGRAVWYAAAPGASDPRGTVWVIYNSGEWVTYPDTWQPGQMESDPGITPPQGRWQPVQRIGKVWRDNPDVRQGLGWAYEAQQPFTGRMQQPTGDDATWTGRSHYWYLDHGKWGIVLRMYSIDNAPNLWEVAGKY